MSPAGRGANREVLKIVLDAVLRTSLEQQNMKNSTDLELVQQKIEERSKKRQKKKHSKMPVSGRSVFKLKQIIIKRRST